MVPAFQTELWKKVVGEAHVATRCYGLCGKRTLQWKNVLGLMKVTCVGIVLWIGGNNQHGIRPLVIDVIFE